MLLLTQLIFNTVLEKHADFQGQHIEVKKLDIQNDQAWKSYEIDLNTLSKKIAEPGVKLYALNIWGKGFKMPDGSIVHFPGHTLTILQTLSDNQEANFEIIQSYVDKYTLKNFLEKKESKALNLNEIKEIIQAWSVVIHSKEKWTAETVSAWKEVTHVESEAWRNGKPIDLETSMQCLELPEADFKGEKGNATLRDVERALENFKQHLKERQIASASSQAKDFLFGAL